MPPFISELLLPGVAALCFALWTLTLAGGKRRRFEFYALDFCWGVLLFGLTAAFTLASVAEEGGISERLLLTSKTSQALALFAGFVFGLGLLALLAGIRLIGISLSLTVALSIASIGAAGLAFANGNRFFPAVAVVLLVVSVVAAIRASRSVDPPPVVSRDPRRPPPTPFMRRSSKGLLFALIAGFFFALGGPLGLSGVAGVLGVGPYAGLLLFAIGIPLAILPFSFFLLHVTVDLPPSRFREYFSTGAHGRGFFGGILYAVGLLAYLVARTANTPEITGHATAFAVGGAVLATCTGVLFYREGGQKQRRGTILIALLLFACGAFLTALQ